LFERVNLDFEYAQTSKRDLLRTKSSLEGSNADLIRAKTNRAVSIQSLNVLIGLSDSVDYLLLLDTNTQFLQVPQSTDAANREVSLKELETKVNENLRRNTWAEFFPTLSITASINNEFFTVDTTDLTGIYLAYLAANPQLPPGTPELLFPENPRPGEYFNPAYFNYSLGVQLNWNIFDGTRNWAQYKQAKLQEEKSKIELKQLKREKDNSISEIRGQIVSIANAITAYRFQYEASEKALEQADLDFKNGFVNAVTYLETDQEYRDAARQLDEAKLQRIILQAQLRLALGLPVYGTP
jgi:outer membrane protein TolC